jgi:L-alanine-DL-glutamate epimerase-like enolase superfamily enzyme
METDGTTNGGAALGTMGPPPPPAVRSRTTHLSPRVEGVEVTAYEIPTERPESDGTLEWDSTTLVLVEAFNGRERGVGYTYADRSVATLIESKLADQVRGADAMRPPAVWAAMRRELRNTGQAGAGSMAISAVDIALWDLKARLLGVSLADALPRVRDSVPIYGSGGFTSYDESELRRQLRGWIQSGIRAVKIKVGRDPDADPARVAVAREVIGPNVELMVDANGAYSLPQALGLAERFAEQDVTWFEEPLSSEDLEGLAELRNRAPAGMAIAAGLRARLLRDRDGRAHRALPRSRPDRVDAVRRCPRAQGRRAAAGRRAHRPRAGAAALGAGGVPGRVGAVSPCA